jgi:hypothetical protein
MSSSIQVNPEAKLCLLALGFEAICCEYYSCSTEQLGCAGRSFGALAGLSWSNSSTQRNEPCWTAKTPLYLIKIGTRPS